MKHYIAYGSNLSLEQMAVRCPDASVVGVGVLTDWKLAFGQHATIEPCEGAEVPVLVWSISDRDERRLDRYEGYPRYYYKDWIPVSVAGEEFTALVYIMTEEQKAGLPTDYYVDIIREGYERFGFDMDVLQNALAECLDEMPAFKIF